MATPGVKLPPLRCSFCNETDKDGRKLIAGPAVFICDECVDVCVQIIADDPRHQAYQRDSAKSQRARAMAATLPRNCVVCSLCGQPALSNEVLAIHDRGVICGGCADAVEDALAEGRPVS